MDKTSFNTYTAWRSYSESSVKTPDFQKKLKQKQRLPINPYSMDVIEGSSPASQTCNGIMTERETRGHGTFKSVCEDGSLMSLWTAYPLGYKLSDHVGEVSNRLLSKVRNKEIDLGVALGEYHETASFVAGAMVKTAKSYKQLRRGDVSGALRTLTGKRNSRWADIPGVASNTWLAYCYGLRPLVNDVANAVKVLDKGLRDPNEPTVVSASSTKSVQGFATDCGVYFDVASGSVRVSGKIEYGIDNPVLYSLEQVGFVNPLSVAWELVPFSFVVDWFVPISDYLTNVIPPQGISFVSGYIAYRGDGTLRSWTANPHNGGWYTSMEQQETFKERMLLTSFPRFSVKVPDLSLSKSQVANGLALLFQHLRM